MKLLIQLYKVYSPSRKEKKMRKFIKDYIRRNVPGAVVNQDSSASAVASVGWRVRERTTRTASGWRCVA